jgi:hypothetical protein
MKISLRSLRHPYGLLVLILLIVNIGVNAQTFTLSGKITGNKDSLLSGEILILHTKDAKLIKVSPFVNGLFEVHGLTANSFILKIEAHGYPDTSITVQLPQVADHNMGTIQLARFSNLGTVTVFARTPLSKRSDEGTILNVDNTVLASSSTTNELLSRSPGVVVSGNMLQVFGKGEALIYLNGKQILYERLASIPVNLIKQVEIITNPSAKYDARGRAVINIVTKKSTDEGWKAVVTQHFTAARHFMSTSAVNLTYAKNKLSLSGDFSLLTGTDWFNNTISSSANYGGGDVYTNFNYYEANTRQPHISNYKLGVGYQINKKSDISIQYDGLDGLKRSGMRTSAKIVVPNSDPTFISTFNDGSVRNANNSVNINYNRLLDSKGSTLFIGGQYNKFTTKTYDQIAEDILKSGTGRKAYRVNDGRNEIDLFTAQFDVVKKLSNARRIEIGGKYSSVVNDGQVVFMSRRALNEELVAFPELSNSFLYEERIPAAYFQYADNSRSKLSFAVGARAEMSIVKGTSRKFKKVVLDSNYVNIFPNAKVTYTFSDKWSLSATYSKRINRPQYQSIDPFVWYQDSLTSFQGNTRLTPELVNSIEALLTFKSFGLKLGYAFSKNVLRAVLVTGNTGPNSFVFTIDNLRRFRQISASLEIPYDTKYWSSYNIVSFNLNEFFDDRPQFKMSMPVNPMFYIYLYQQFKIPKLFNIDLTAEYTSSQSDGITDREPLYQVTTGLSRSFLNNKLSFRLLYNDMFRTQRWWGQRAFGNIFATYDQRFNTNYVRLTTTYRFGRLKKSTYKNKSVNDDQFNRIRR